MLNSAIIPLNFKSLALTFSLFALSFLHILQANPTWTPIQLFEEGRLPRNLVGTVNNIPFPQVPARWYGKKTTGISFKSNYIPDISGFSFAGQITPWDTSEKVPGNLNGFGIFYHQVSNYIGGPEYGIVFRVDKKDIIFYTLSNANLHTQSWEQWPGQLASTELQGNLIQEMGQASKFLKWSITVTSEGNFIVSITDPSTGSISSAEILKPNNFPNLYQTEGYITLNAQKYTNVTLTSNPSLRIEQIEILQQP